MNWLFKPNGSPYLEADEANLQPVNIFTNGHYDKTSQILPTHDRKQFKSLGVRTPATLSDKYEIESMLNKCYTFSKFLHSCPLTKLETKIAYTMFFIPSLTYSTVTLSLSQSVITRMHSTYFPDLLPKLGYQATFPRSFVFAPRHIGGVGLTPLNVIIAQKKIQLLYRHLRKGTELGKACLINIKW